MKSYLTILVFSLVVLLFSRCSGKSDAAENNMKDLDQNMLDMMMYHDNLGTHLRKGEADYSSWLLEGMDSSLQVIAEKFVEHPKLTDPFEKSYRKKLQPAIKDIRKALEQNNFTAAISAYRILTKKCNGCHIDHDVDKVVSDLTDPAYN